MVINNHIENVLRNFNIPYNDGLAYLLSIYFDSIPSYIPDVLKHKINATGIFSIDSNMQINWLIPLFEDIKTIDSKWEWVTEWMQLFKQANKDRVGLKSAVINRMKLFFSENPDIRKEDIFKITEMYIKNTQPQYIKKSHKFIYDGAGKLRTSTLEEWMEKYNIAFKSIEQTNNVKSTLNNFMQ